jgi:hypothetical protein
LLLAALLASPARAQSAHQPRPYGSGDLVFASANGLIGGLTAGALRAARGGAFWPAFRDGVLGGAVSYAGRRVAAESFPGAGLAGRQVGAVGASIVSNAAHGRPVLQLLVLPVGPIRLYLHHDSGWSATLKLDLPTTAGIVYFALQSNTRFDAPASFSSGAPVFQTRVRFADGYWAGQQVAGSIRLEGNPADPAPDAPRTAVLAHERVHVLQYDYAMSLWSDPLEARLFAGRGAPAWLRRHVDAGVHLAAWQLANWLVPYESRPWEAEAHFLSRVRADR